MRSNRNRWLIAAGLALGLAAPLRATDPGKKYVPDFGLSSGLYATGSSIMVSYYGWEATTYFGHTIYAMTTTDYANNLANGCFWFYASARSNCLTGSTDLGALMGTSLFTKQFDVRSNPYLPTPQVQSLGWAQYSEIVFALRVYQGDGTAAENPGAQYNWFFSGDKTRNNDGLAHLAFFSPPLYPSGVPRIGTPEFIPDTRGASLYGFEDVIYHDSDWDFNNALFSLDGTSGPTELVPEPITLTLLATGLAGLGAVRRRRRRTGSAPV